MAAINFPDSPSINDEFTVGDRTWMWDGTVWLTVESNAVEGPTGPTGPTGPQGEYGDPTLTISSTTDSDRTLEDGDQSTLIRMSSSSAHNVVIPNNSAAPFAIGTQISVVQEGTGQVTFTATSPATVVGTPGLKMRDQWSGATVVKIGTDAWWVSGDLTA